MSVFTELDREWHDVGTSRNARHRLQTWTSSSPALAGYATPAELVIDANRRGDPLGSDQILVAVTRHAIAGDDLAGRTLLQAILPGLKALTRRYQPIGSARGHDTANLVLAYAWEHIRAFPLDRRPARIAANLVYDTQQRLHRHINRPVLDLVPLDVLVHEPAAPPTGDNPHDWLEHAIEHSILTAGEATLIAVTRLGHHTIAELAPAFDCDPATLRRRRRRAETRLASIHR
jgi:DNA-directed RNA polymerase specialized sigma24 family protein